MPRTAAPPAADPLGMALQTAVDLSTPQRVAAWSGLGVIGIAAFMWNRLTDSDLAHTDRASRKLMARVRRSLRKVFGIHVI